MLRCMPLLLLSLSFPAYATVFTITNSQIVPIALQFGGDSNFKSVDVSSVASKSTVSGTWTEDEKGTLVDWDIRFAAAHLTNEGVIGFPCKTSADRNATSFVFFQACGTPSSTFTVTIDTDGTTIFSSSRMVNTNTTYLFSGTVASHAPEPGAIWFALLGLVFLIPWKRLWTSITRGPRYTVPPVARSVNGN